MPCQHSHIDLDERVSDGLRVRALQSMQLVTLLGVDGMNPRQRQAMLAAGVYLPPPQHVIGTVGEHTVTLDLRAMTYYCSACPAFQHERICYHLLAVWAVAREARASARRLGLGRLPTEPAPGRPAAVLVAVPNSMKDDPRARLADDLRRLAGLLDACIEIARRLKLPVPNEADACVRMLRGWSRNLRYPDDGPA